MGYNPSGDDIDDCKILPGLCSHGTCINTLGGYRCACDHGYKPTNTKRACAGKSTNFFIVIVFECMIFYYLCCIATNLISKCVNLDINECSASPAPCSFDCRNTDGGFECVCPKGYRPGQDGSDCVGKIVC